MAQFPGPPVLSGGSGEPTVRSAGSLGKTQHEQRESASAGTCVQQPLEGLLEKARGVDGRSKTWKDDGNSASSWRLGNLSLLSGSNVTHRLADMGRSLVARLSPAPVESSFIEKGTLTPQEFVDAGDQLSFKFPTWQWQGSVDAQRKCSWLPPDKQYLIARSVPCYRRVREMDQALLHQEADGGWMLPLLHESDEQQGDGEKEGLPELTQAVTDHVVKEQTVLLGSRSAGQVAPRSSNPLGRGLVGRDTSVDTATHVAATIRAEGASDDTCAEVAVSKSVFSIENAIPDISSLANIDDLLQEEDDPAALKAPTYFVRSAPDAEIVAARTYDVSITYDKYFQTPRIWLFGYNENGLPLSPEEIFEDILTEYAAKTVTVDPHPCTGIPTASIHPCRHASVMKKVVDSWIERGMKPRHDLALLALLKFISGVMPTIEYDFTMDIDMFIHSVAGEALK